MVVYIKVKS